MDDLLQYIDLDYYRSAQLLIAHAEIAQLRRQSSGPVANQHAHDNGSDDEKHCNGD